eukprot:gene3180-3651_t
MEPCNAIERADIVSPVRLQGFSDAVFATAATLLVIPIRKLELEKHETLKEGLIRRFPELAVFVIGFMIICTIWQSHSLRFKIISKIDDFVVALTLLSLMFTTFLPFTVALEGKYDKEQVAVILPCIILLVLEIFECIMFVYAFHTPRLLSRNLTNLSPSAQKSIKLQTFGKIALNSFLFILAASFGTTSVVVSRVLLTTVIFSPLIQRLVIYCIKRCCSSNGEEVPNLLGLKGRIEKERIEYFSDAAIAIVATLLVLDITTEDFPKKATVIKNGLGQTLVDMWQMFVSYMGSFVTVAILWFVHHSVLHQIKFFNPAMNLCNNLFLACLAGTPFVSTLVNKFAGKSNHNEKIAVRVSSVIIFGAGFMQFTLFILAFLKRDIMMYSWAIPGGTTGQRTHTYTVLKTIIIPILTLLTFFTSLSSDYATFVVYHVSLVLVPLSFLVLKIVFACHCHQQSAGEDPRSLENSMEERSSDHPTIDRSNDHPAIDDSAVGNDGDKNVLVTSLVQ